MATAAIYSHAKRSLATLVSLLLVLVWVPAALMSTPASAASGATTVTPVPVNENCNGVIPTPGSENTEKKLIGGTLEPGGTAIFEITYPIDPADIGQTFTVTDCPVLGANVHDAQAYQFTFVPNNTSFTVEFTLIIPADTPIGTSYCNYAKTTASPSAPQASNRKAGPACFTVGGNLRIEKHATGNTTDLLAGAQFDVSCPTDAPTVPITESPVIITGLVDGNGDPVVATYDTATHAWTASGTADPGFIGISGPSGTVCTVTETAAPPGYELPDVTTHQYTIPVGTSQQVEEWFNAPSAPNLHLVKSADPVSGSTVDLGSTIDYTLAYYNDGNADATNTTITDTLPVHTTYVTGSASDGGTYDAATRTITWTGIDVAAGTTAADPAGTVTFSVTVDANTPNGTELDNTGHIQLGTDTPIPSNTTEHFVKFPVIGALKSSDPASGTVAAPAPVTPGQTIDYTITVSNTGLADATGVTVSDAIPAGTTYVAGSADNGGILTAGVLTWSGLTVTAGGTLDLHFQVTVDGTDADGTLIDNTATVNDVPTNTTHHEVVTPALAIAKTADPVSGSVVQPGDQIDYTITVTNTGHAAALGETVTDTLPANVTVIDGSIDPAAQTADATKIVWVIDVPAATADGPETVVLTYSVTVNADAPQGSTLTNLVTLGDHQSTTEHHVATGDLTLVKHVDKATASYGDTLTYTFDAATTGDLDQTTVVVTDVVPDHTTYVAGSAGCTDAGTCVATYSSATNTVTWQLGNIAAGGATRHLTFQVTIDQPAAFDPATGVPAETILNSGVIGSTETQPTPSNEVKTPVTAVLGIKLVKPPVTPPATSPSTLPFTGLLLPFNATLFVALTLIGSGLALMATRRRRS
jgi:uncharacterized repeat protein (TIGR01451 family)